MLLSSACGIDAVGRGPAPGLCLGGADPPDFSVTPAMVPHPGADWASEHRKRAEAIRREHEHTIAYYENMAKERAEREERERAMSGAHVDVIGAMVCKPAGTP